MTLLESLQQDYQRLLALFNLYKKSMPVDTNVESLLGKFALAIRDYEGVPGDRNYRNNNPGNCRYSSVGYLAKYEPVEKDADSKDCRASYYSMAKI